MTQSLDERRKYVFAFNNTMIKIWREQIALLNVIDTGALYRSTVAVATNADDKIVESREIGRVRENITKALKLIATRCNLSVVPSLKMTKDIYLRAIDNVSVSKII